MSVSKNRHEAERWLLTAEEDLRGLETARVLVAACREWLEQRG